MKCQPTKNYESNDVVYTPTHLAGEIVSHFSPKGKMLEPCRGNGSFLRHMDNADWCEISEGKDFFDYTKKVDWIITNPPWSKITPFLKHSLEIAENVVFLVTVNHMWTECRIRAIRDAGFKIKEILLIDWPDKSYGFPKSGFQLGVIHIKRKWNGKTTILDLR